MKNTEEALRLLNEEANQNMSPSLRLEILKRATENKLIVVILTLFGIENFRADEVAIAFALRWSAIEDQISVLEKLLICDVIKDRVDVVYNALHLAAEHGNHDAVTKLLRSIILHERKMRRPATCHFKLSRKPEQGNRFIVSDLETIWKNSVLLFAINNGHDRVVNEMLKYKSVRRGLVLQDHQLLRDSAKSGNLVIFRLLIEAYKNEEFDIPLNLYYFSNRIPADLSKFWIQIKSINSLIRSIFPDGTDSRNFNCSVFVNPSNYSKHYKPTTLILEYASMPDMNKPPSATTVEDILKDNGIIESIAIQIEKDQKMLDTMMMKPIYSKGEIYDAEREGIRKIQKFVAGIVRDAAEYREKCIVQQTDHDACRELSEEMKICLENIHLYKKQLFIHAIHFLFLQIQELASDHRILEDVLKKHLKDSAEDATLFFLANKVQEIRMKAEVIINALDNHNHFTESLAQMDALFETLYRCLMTMNNIAILNLHAKNREFLSESSESSLRIILKIEYMQFERMKLMISETMQILEKNLQSFNQEKDSCSEMRECLTEAEAVLISAKVNIIASRTVVDKVKDLLEALKVGKKVQTIKYVEVGKMLAQVIKEAMSLHESLISSNKALNAQRIAFSRKQAELQKNPVEFVRSPQTMRPVAIEGVIVAIASTTAQRKKL